MKPLPMIFSVLIPIAVVIFIILTSVFLWMNPIIWDSLYNSPGFPPDTYGFTAKDRMTYSRISLEYMVNDAGISFLANQKLRTAHPCSTNAS